MRAAAAIRTPAPFVVLAALAAALLVGIATAERVSLGLGLVAAALFAFVAITNLPLGIALWMPAFFLTFTTPGNLLLRGGFVVVGLALIASWRRGEFLEPLRRQRALVALVAGLLAWLALSVAWAHRPSLVVSEIWVWALAVFVAAAIVLGTRRDSDVVLVIGGLAAGAVLSAALGLFGDQLGINVGTLAAASDTQGRLAGGSGDANQLAAGLVPGIALAIGVNVTARRTATRVASLVAVALAVVGIAASESRGGFIALGVLLVAMLILLPQARSRLAAVLAVCVVVAGVYFASEPSAFHRITKLDSSGTGRNELWRIATRIAADNPVGVGLNNFRAVAPSYALDSGPLNYVNLIVERPVVAHNTYLQLLAETGAVGLGLFLAVIGASLAAGWRAARRYEALGDVRMATLARAVIAAVIGFLVAAFFVSFGQDYRMWALLALGPALLNVVSRRTAATST